MGRALDIVVPVFNEAACIDEFYDRVARLGLADALLFVDNASTDATAERLARRPGVRVIRHARNEGYGASIRDGIAASDAELVVIIDADLEYPPEAIPALVGALRDHPVVYASRFLGQGTTAMPALRRAGNRLVSGAYNLLFGQHTTDLYTGMKGFRRCRLPLAALRRPGFEHVLELAVLVSLAGERIHEIPIAYVPRSRGTSKMRHLPEMLKFVGLVVGYWLRCVVLGRPLHGQAVR